MQTEIYAQASRGHSGVMTDRKTQIQTWKMPDKGNPKLVKKQTVCQEAHLPDRHGLPSPAGLRQTADSSQAPSTTHTDYSTETMCQQAVYDIAAGAETHTGH